MTSNQIRAYAREKYVQPAVARGERSIRLRAGDIHKELILKNRVPAVCQALESKKFLNENNLVLESKEGPPSGLSTSVVFTYRVASDPSAPGEPTPEVAAKEARGRNLLRLLELEGIGKEVFASLGGGENFMRAEREALNESLLKRERERGL